MSAEPKPKIGQEYACPNCGCQIYDPLLGKYLIHNIETCETIPFTYAAEHHRNTHKRTYSEPKLILYDELDGINLIQTAKEPE